MNGCIFGLRPKLPNVCNDIYVCRTFCILQQVVAQQLEWLPVTVAVTLVMPD